MISVRLYLVSLLGVLALGFLIGVYVNSLQPLAYDAPAISSSSSTAVVNPSVSASQAPVAAAPLSRTSAVAVNCEPGSVVQEVVEQKVEAFKAEFIAEQTVMQRSREFGEKMDQKIRENPSYRLADDLEQQFTLQPVDIHWADEYENRLSDVFLSTDDMRHFYPDNIECKSDRCKLQIRVADTVEGSQVASRFAELLIAQQDQFPSSRFMTSLDETLGVMNVYLVRSDEVELIR